MLTTKEAEYQVGQFARAYSVSPLTLPIVLEAARGVRDYQLAYFDASLGSGKTESDSSHL